MYERLSKERGRQDILHVLRHVCTDGIVNKRFVFVIIRWKFLIFLLVNFWLYVTGEIHQVNYLTLRTLPGLATMHDVIASPHSSSGSGQAWSRHAIHHVFRILTQCFNTFYDLEFCIYLNNVLFIIFSCF